MDETLFYIVIFLVYMAFQVLSARKKKKKRAVQGTATPLPSPKGQPATAPTGAEPTLEDALREIRQALGMQKTTAPAKTTTTQLPPLPQSRPRPTQQKEQHTLRGHGPSLAETAPKKAWSDEFRAYPTHYADSDFEELAGEGDRFGKERTKKKTSRATPSSAKILSIKTAKTSPDDSRFTRVLRQLQSPKTAQDAFILGEILGPPRMRKRH